MNKVKCPVRYQKRCEAIYDDCSDNDEVQFVVDLAKGWVYRDEYVSYSCEDWVEVLNVLRYCEYKPKLFKELMGI